MYFLKGFRASAEIKEQIEIERIISLLEVKGYRPILRAVAQKISEVANLEADPVTISDVLPKERMLVRRRPYGIVRYIGELFFKEDIAYLIYPIGRSLQCWAFSKREITSEIETFLEDVHNVAITSIDGRRLRGMDFSWKPIVQKITKHISATVEYQEVTEFQVTDPEYSEKELSAAFLLVNENARKLLMHLAKLTRARSSDTASFSKEPDITALLENDLIRTEYLVTCKQDSHTICSVPDKEQIESADKEFRCPTCGKSFKDEYIQEIYSVTELGKKLLAGSHWMTIWITDILISEGLEQTQIKWGVAAQGEELDIMVEVFGTRTFIELKDREFGLGDAYPFVFRVDRYGGRIGLVVTMDKVSKDAKQFLEERQQGTQIAIFQFEGADQIKREIANLVSVLSLDAIRHMIAPLAERVNIELANIVSNWLEKR